MICYVLPMGKQHLGPHVVVGYGIKIFWPGLFITSPDHLEEYKINMLAFSFQNLPINLFQLKTKLSWMVRKKINLIHAECAKQNVIQNFSDPLKDLV